MPTFPRTVKSRITTPPEMPAGYEQWGQSGKGQFRAHENTGRMWQEIYPAINLNHQDGRALMAAINQAQREKIIWDIQHPQYVTNYGVASGSPVVDGGSQTGATLDIRSGPTNITNWLRYGDIIQVTGLQLVIDVVGNVNTDGSGDATIPIHPPIFTGQSPSDGAAVTVNAANIWFKAVLVVLQMPDIEAHGVVNPGMTLVWREQPSA
jgi:hypothetical protein